MDYVFDILRTTDVFSFPIISILIGVGFIVGFINTVSGGATAISYALFMAMGMPLTVANATTRLGVTMQFLTSTIVFGKKGIINKTDALRVGVPVALGSIGGAMVACEVNRIMPVNYGNRRKMVKAFCSQDGFPFTVVWFN